jgi:hypothetical protein
MKCRRTIDFDSSVISPEDIPCPETSKSETPMRLPATPVIARMMLTIAPIPTERNGFTLGITVLKLFAAMNDEKHAPGNAASVLVGDFLYSKSFKLMTEYGNLAIIKLLFLPSCILVMEVTS